MIPLLEVSMVLRDDYITKHIDELYERIDNLFNLVGTLRNKHRRVQSISVDLIHLLRSLEKHQKFQDEQLQAQLQYIYKLHTILVKNTVVKRDEIEELTQLLKNLSLQ